MITIAMSTAVSSSRDHVWRVLTNPDELMRLDERILSIIDPVDGYPVVGQRIRWRYRLGTIPVVLRNSPVEVIPGERLRSATALGLFRFEETFTLADEIDDPKRTRLRLKLSAANSLPVVGGLLDRFAVRQMAAEIVDHKLRSVQKWCENHA